MRQKGAGLLFLGGLAIGALSATVFFLAREPEPGLGHGRAGPPRAARGVVSGLGPRTRVVRGGGPRGGAGVVEVSDDAAGALRQWSDASYEEAQGTAALGAVLELYALAGRAPEFAAVARRLLAADPESAARVLAAIDLLPRDLRAPLLEELVDGSAALRPVLIHVAARLHAAGRSGRAFALLGEGLAAGGPEALDLVQPMLAADPDRTVSIALEVARAQGWQAAGYNALARLASAQERKDLALSVVRAALQLGATDDETLQVALEVDPATAETIALRRTQADPKDASAWQLLSHARTALGNTTGAFRAMEQYARIDRSRTALQALTGIDAARAVDIVRELTAETTDDEAIGALAINLKSVGRPREAFDAYLRAHRIDPTDSEWLRGMIDLDAVSAVGVFEAMLEEGRGRNNDEILGAYAHGLRAAGRTEDAWETFLEAMRLDSTDSEWMQGLAEIDPHRTVDVLQAELDRNPGNETAFSQMAEVLARVGRQDEALGMMREVIQRSSSPYGMLMTLSASMPEEALALTRSRLQQAPGDDELWGTLGKILFAREDSQAALDAFRRANRIDPGDGEWHDYLRRLGVEIETVPDTHEVWESLDEPLAPASGPVALPNR